MPSLRDVSLFLLDMDGTIYLGDRLFDCTKPFLETLRAQGKRHLFLTNNSSKDRMAYVAKLARLGIEAAPDDVFTSGEATTLRLRSTHPGAAVAVFGMRASGSSNAIRTSSSSASTRRSTMRR